MWSSKVWKSEVSNIEDDAVDVCCLKISSGANSFNGVNSLFTV